MSEGRGATNDRAQAGRYEVRVTGHLHGRWAAWLDGMRLRHDVAGHTVIHGLVADQAALHGLLQRVRDAGMQLISVTRVDDEEPSDADAGPPIGPIHGAVERNDDK